ncbi:SerT (predicted) [Pycnogonum litorale]
MFFVVMHGSRGIGSIVYYTATLPFMFITILIVRSCSLDGAMDGLKIFCTPEWSNLLNIKAWVSAATTVMGSLGLTSGSVIVYGSYNKFRNNCLVDAFTISLIDFGTSVMSCLIFFPAVGNMAARQNLTTDEVLSVEWIHPLRLYLSVISYLPSPTLWCVVFSITICLLYIDTIFGLVETVVSALVEEITWLKSRRKSVCFVVCVVLFLIGIPFSTKDSYALNFTILYPYNSWISIILSNCFVLAILLGYGKVFGLFNNFNIDNRYC